MIANVILTFECRFEAVSVTTCSNLALSYYFQLNRIEQELGVKDGPYQIIADIEIIENV